MTLDPTWELILGPVGVTVLLVYIAKLLNGRLEKLDKERHEQDAATIQRLISERDLALAGWREQTALTNAAVQAFAAERSARRSRTPRPAVR